MSRPEATEIPLFGGMLRARRRSMRVSQRELGRRAGLSPSAICQYELGAIEPTLSSLRALAAALGTSVAELIGDREIENVAEACIAARIARLDLRDRELVEAVLRAVERP